jgi:UPF0755 protein
MRRLLVGLSLLLGCVVLFSELGFQQWLNNPIALKEEDRVLVLKKGDSVARLAYQLERKGVLCNPRLLIGYARLTGQDNIKVGEYQLEEGITPAVLLSRLVAGDVVRYSITLVEGWTVNQAITHIQQQPEIVKTLHSEAEVAQWFAGFELPNKNPEGWLFPDTYQFERGATDKELLERALLRMREVLEQEWLMRDKSLPYANAYEALIMASIVERETGVASERGEIAGVFVRRLNKGMRLQTDPTVIYGLGDSYKGNIRRKHLRQPTPYNTYVIKGLPPTPIALAGREAINAALNPREGKSLYFVAKGDGSHYFSETLEEHERAVKQYQLKRVENYRSSPNNALQSTSTE